MTDKGAAGRPVKVDMDARDVDTDAGQRVQVQSAEVIIADRRDDGDRLTWTGGLIGENGSCALRKRTGQRLRILPAFPNRVRHDFCEDLSDHENFSRLLATPLAEPTAAIFLDACHGGHLESL